jgi:hypothetical protein
MRGPFLPSNAKIDKVVIDATTGKDAGYENMKMALRHALQNEGIIVRNPDAEIDVRLNPAYQQQHPQPTAPPQPAAPLALTCYRVIYPRGNDRYEIHGVSEEEIDQKEAAIRAALGR